MRNSGFLLAHCVAFLFVAFFPFQLWAQSTWRGQVPLRDVPLPAVKDRYPVKNGSNSIQEAYSKIAEWEGHAVSVEGLVKSIVMNPRRQPSIELSMGGTTIWATWPLVADKNFESTVYIGERFRILGWVRSTSAWSKFTGLNLPRQNPLTLLPICLVKVRNSDAIFDGKYVEYCEAWRKGYMPPNMKR
jgi:hypothetical protein